MLNKFIITQAPGNRIEEELPEGRYTIYYWDWQNKFPVL